MTKRGCSEENLDGVHATAGVIDMELVRHKKEKAAVTLCKACTSILQSVEKVSSTTAKAFQRIYCIYKYMFTYIAFELPGALFGLCMLSRSIVASAASFTSDDSCCFLSFPQPKRLCGTA
jgi:hypothetical protein